jgi:hypothetical protein
VALDLTQIDLLLGMGVLVAVIAIVGGIRGVYSISALARQDRSNQSTTTLPIPTRPGKDPPSDKPAQKGRKAA